MRIAFVIKRFPFPYSYFLNQVRGLIDRGHDVRIIALRRGDANLHPISVEYGLSDRTRFVNWASTYPQGFETLATTLPALWIKHSVSKRRLLRTFTSGKLAPNQFEAMRTLLDYESIDICHAHFGKTGEVVRPAVAELDIPLVVSFYGSGITGFSRRGQTRYKSMFQMVDAVTALSDSMEDRLLDIGCPASKFEKIPLAIEAGGYPFRERHGAHGEPVQLLSVGRLVEMKGHSYAIDAVATLEEKLPIEYRIIGDGPLREQLEAEIRSRGLTDTVELLGYREHPEMKEWMDRSDLFVHPSIVTADETYEGTPTALLEAQASGLPVVSTNHEGIPEIVADGESGLLVPERDSDALAHAMELLIESPDRWPDMGHAGRRLVEENHDPSEILDDLEALYDAQMH